MYPPMGHRKEMIKLAWRDYEGPAGLRAMRRGLLEAFGPTFTWLTHGNLR
jgi:hypothetical protein